MNDRTAASLPRRSSHTVLEAALSAFPPRCTCGSRTAQALLLFRGCQLVVFRSCTTLAQVIEACDSNAAHHIIVLSMSEEVLKAEYTYQDHITRPSFRVRLGNRAHMGATISLADGSVGGFLLEHSAVFALDFQPGPAGSRISYVS